MATARDAGFSQEPHPVSLFFWGRFLFFRSCFVLGLGPGFFGEVDIDSLKAYLFSLCSKLDHLRSLVY